MGWGMEVVLHDTANELAGECHFARFMPRRPATAIAQRFRLENRPARVSITLAAS